MSEINRQELLKRKKTILIITAAIIFCAMIYIIISFTEIKIPCVFNKITSLKCPGCGNTRAVKAILQLDIKRAFVNNYLFPLELGYIAWIYLKACHSYIKNKSFTYRTPHPALDIAVLVIILLWGLIRNLLKV